MREEHAENEGDMVLMASVANTNMGWKMIALSCSFELFIAS